MKREEKKELVEALHERFSKARALVLTDFRGLDTAAMHDLRCRLRGASIEYRVVKNTLMSRASDGTDVALLKDYFSGPSAVALSYDDPIAPARVLTKFSEEHAALEVKAGIVEGRVIDAEGIKRLSKLPSREGLLSQLLSVLNGPATSLLMVLNGVPRQFLGVLHAIGGQKESA
ncbi:MAG: 50S ribosomal protein L10 [Thermodesulfobacteriota bacterium]|nr:50S ribosomal protein L10 [Thermodesulfobacteriota bacterium]